MTEAEWLACETTEHMTIALGHSISSRKLGLFAVACCRRVWDLFTDERSRNAVDVIELRYDGNATKRERELARDAAEKAKSLAASTAAMGGFHAGVYCPLYVIRELRSARDEAGTTDRQLWSAFNQRIDTEPAAQAALLRDVVGNPFRPVAFCSSWLTSTVLALARGIYEDRAFDRMPYLADALQDAGCDHEDILNHSRDENGTHVRGCWVVDLVLGKS